MQPIFKWECLLNRRLSGSLIASLVLFISWSSTVRVTATELLDSVKMTKGLQIELHGDFGQDCKQCEIIADYGSGFKYAYHPNKWHAKKLSFTIKDLGKSLNVDIQVRTSTQLSNKKHIKLIPNLKPDVAINRIVITPKPSNGFTYSAKHQDPFGGKGIDSFNISTIKPGCNQKALSFNHAQLIVDKKRFGDARIESKPKPACLNCSPIKVRWYHEPTGSITYQLHVQRRQIEGVCQKYLRR